MTCPICKSRIPDPPILLFRHLLNWHKRRHSEARMIYLGELAKLIAKQHPYN